ncbi:MAG TPA: hypothetical protein PLT00_01320 [Verrucomicrobiota bacterium]|nr:hypothetical protein [Verrucomicrobiota bacterium]HQB15335.1 hypothetical protein [Verrucomicrobiota bacterium]
MQTATKQFAEFEVEGELTQCAWIKDGQGSADDLPQSKFTI